MFSQLRYVQECLKPLSYSELRVVANESNVPFGTVRRIASKYTKNPGAQAIDMLALHFRTKEKRAQ